MIDLEGRINDKRIYSVWEGMKARCCNPKSRLYHRYGGRGITICEEWATNSRNFIKWAYENGYNEDSVNKSCELDRIDNDKGYFPENCRFVSHIENMRNKSGCHIVEYRGEKKHWKDWCECLKISKKAVEHCISRYGLTYQQAFDRYTNMQWNVKTQKWEYKNG